MSERNTFETSSVAVGQNQGQTTEAVDAAKRMQPAATVSSGQPGGNPDSAGQTAPQSGRPLNPSAPEDSNTTPGMTPRK
jgi:hypothetical protein